MCLSKVYNKRNGDLELLLEEVASVEIGQDRLTFKTLFGEQKEMEGNIKQIDFLTHSILLESPGAK
jgi:predicted RNA-binding protein